MEEQVSRVCRVWRRERGAGCASAMPPLRAVCDAVCGQVPPLLASDATGEEWTQHCCFDDARRSVNTSSRRTSSLRLRDCALYLASIPSLWLVRTVFQRGAASNWAAEHSRRGTTK